MGVETMILEYRQNGLQGVRSGLQGIAGDADGAEGKFDGLKQTIAGAFALAGLNAVSNKLVDLGGDATETRSLIETAFGSSTNAINAWGDNLQSTLGTSSLEAQKNAATFNLMFGSMKLGAEESLKMSKGLTQLAGDMTSLYNLDPGEAFEKLKSGIVGEAEPLGALGVLLNSTTIEAYALANGIGKAGQELTENEKVLARYGSILEQTKAAHGDLAKTIDSPANAARRLETGLLTLQTTMGEGGAAVRGMRDNALIPLVSSLTEGHSETLKFAGGLLEVGTQAANVLAPVGAVGKGIIDLLSFYKLSKIAKIADTGITLTNATAHGTAATAVGAHAQANVAALIAQDNETRAEIRKLPILADEVIAHNAAATATLAHARANGVLAASTVAGGVPGVGGAAAAGADGAKFLGASAFGATGAAAVGIGAGAAVGIIYGGAKLVEGMNAVTKSNEDLIAQHGIWGEIWSKGGDAASSASERVSPAAALAGGGLLGLGASAFINDGLGNNSAAGSDAEKRSAALFAKMRGNAPTASETEAADRQRQADFQAANPITPTAPMRITNRRDGARVLVLPESSGDRQARQATFNRLTPRIA